MRAVRDTGAATDPAVDMANVGADDAPGANCGASVAERAGLKDALYRTVVMCAPPLQPEP